MAAFTEHDLSKAEVVYNKLTKLNRDVIVLFKELEKDYADQPNFKYWMDYMELVSILLNLIRAKREGNWELYLVSFLVCCLGLPCIITQIIQDGGQYT